MSGYNLQSNFLQLNIKPYRLVFFTCEHNLRSMPLHSNIFYAIQDRTRHFDLMIGNFFDRPPNLFRLLDSILYECARVWRDDPAGEIRLLLRESLPEWQHGQVQTIAQRVIKEFGDDFPRLQVGRWYAQGSSQVKAEQYAWQNCPWLIPLPTGSHRPSGDSDLEAEPVSKPWCS